MVSTPHRGMQNRKGLINGGPNREDDVNVEEIERHIDTMTYLAFAGMGIFLGALIALYLTGGI